MRVGGLQIEAVGRPVEIRRADRRPGGLQIQISGTPSDVRGPRREILGTAHRVDGRRSEESASGTRTPRRARDRGGPDAEMRGPHVEGGGPEEHDRGTPIEIRGPRQRHRGPGARRSVVQKPRGGRGDRAVRCDADIALRSRFVRRLDDLLAGRASLPTRCRAWRRLRLPPRHEARPKDPLIGGEQRNPLHTAGGGDDSVRRIAVKVLGKACHLRRDSRRHRQEMQRPRIGGGLKPLVKATRRIRPGRARRASRLPTG